MASIATKIRQFPAERPSIALVGAVLGCIVVGASGAIFTTQGLSSWYGTLVRPALAPPNWVFGPVWTILFALMGVALWQVWRRAARTEPTSRTGRQVRVAVGLFAVQFAFNLAWSAVFFGSRSIGGGLVVIGILLLLILATIRAFDAVDRRAAVLLVPYLGWVSFAAYLNFQFWVLN
jgi:tryptophan-rich sensory protein